MSDKYKAFNGGEVLVVCLDVKVAWPRTAAKPGRLQIAQLERSRGVSDLHPRFPSRLQPAARLLRSRCKLQPFSLL